jgi:exosortase/archaeosortase family protein
VYLAGGRAWATHFKFPILFFLVAVPWPTPLEGFTIQNLTRLNAATVVELLNAVGTPAVLHGNVIEVSKGVVGVDEACSGIRSVQATLMIGLFFGEMYRLTLGRRLGLVAIGLGLAVLFNLVRTIFLSWIASQKGTDAIQQWHDPAGITILLLAFFGIWIAGFWLGRHREKEGGNGNDESTSSNPLGTGIPIPATSQPAATGLKWSIALGMVAWVIGVEIATEIWFRTHETRGAKAIHWSVRWPESNPTYKVLELSAATRQILQCDEGASRAWADPGGLNWHVFFLRWQPANSFYGRMRVALAKTHTPEACLQGAGMVLRKQFEPVTVALESGLQLQFRRYLFEAMGRPTHVFFAVVEDQLNFASADFLRATHASRWRAALAGSRNLGQRSFEAVISGVDSPDEALRAFQQQLPHLIQVH